AKRSLGQGWRICVFGSHSLTNFSIRSHVKPSLWLAAGAREARDGRCGDGTAQVRDYSSALMIVEGNHPVKAAASLFAALGSRAEVFFLGEARLGGVAAVCDATEGVFDRKRIECIGIVVARPFFEMGMARMSTVSDRFEQFVE